MLDPRPRCVRPPPHTHPGARGRGGKAKMAWVWRRCRHRLVHAIPIIIVSLYLLFPLRPIVTPRHFIIYTSLFPISTLNHHHPRHTYYRCHLLSHLPLPHTHTHTLPTLPQPCFTTSIPPLTRFFSSSVPLHLSVSFTQNTFLHSLAPQHSSKFSVHQRLPHFATLTANTHLHTCIQTHFPYLMFSSTRPQTKPPTPPCLGLVFLFPSLPSNSDPNKGRQLLH